MWKEGIFALFLLTAALQDIRRRSIDLWVLLLFAFLGILFCFLDGEDGLKRILGCLTGGGLIFVSRAAKDGIGRGDGFFFVVSGFYLGAVKNLELLFYGLITAAALGGILILTSKKGERNLRNTAFPFIPFLVPVWIGMMIL